MENSTYMVMVSSPEGQDWKLAQSQAQPIFTYQLFGLSLTLSAWGNSRQRFN